MRGCLNELKKELREVLPRLKFLEKIEGDYCLSTSDNVFTNLYYLFPLFEAVIREILMCDLNANIEFYSQGKYRTLTSIIGNNKKLLNNIIGIELVDKIEYYFNDSTEKVSLRNLIMHNKTSETITFPVNELHEIYAISKELIARLEEYSNYTELLPIKEIEFN